MSRQRLRPSLGESSHIVCPRCDGIGSIRGVESMALAILRLIGEELRKDRTARVIAQVPVEVATYLINEKREWLRTLEDKSAAELIIVPNANMQTPEYSIRRVRDDEMELPENRQASYLMPTAAEVVEPGSEKTPARGGPGGGGAAAAHRGPYQRPRPGGGPGSARQARTAASGHASRRCSWASPGPRAASSPPPQRPPPPRRVRRAATMASDATAGAITAARGATPTARGAIAATDDVMAGIGTAAATAGTVIATAIAVATQTGGLSAPPSAAASATAARVQRDRPPRRRRRARKELPPVPRVRLASTGPSAAAAAGVAGGAGGAAVVARGKARRRR